MPHVAEFGKNLRLRVNVNVIVIVFFLEFP